MELEHYSENDIEFVRLPKRILMADAKETKKRLHSLIGRARPLLALDMSAVEYIDSSGLAVLVSCLKSSRRKSGDVCLFGMQDTVRTLFELTRLHHVFPIEEKHQDAVLRLSA
jgi:anti-sigma B factor antagonist